MKILLIGEYSRLHNSLKEGLAKLDHDVQIKGLNDGFKNYTVDFKIAKKAETGFWKKIKMGIYLMTGFDITSYLTYLTFVWNKKEFKGYDVVQLINENSFHCQPYFEKKIIAFIFKNNKKVFLLSCGDDFINVKHHFNHPEFPSIIQPFLSGKIKPKNFSGVLKFRTKEYQKLHVFLYQRINGVIASDLDYHVPLQQHSKYLGLIANPVNTEKNPFSPLETNNEVVIFFGINGSSFYKKGGDFFEKALEIIKEKYKNKVQILISKNIPYTEYIELYNQAHIVLDQVYALDQGYNALEAMSKGKVVFTGASALFINHYKLTERVAVNALPDTNYLVDELSFLIENPNEIVAIGKRARLFIEKEHFYVTIAQKYGALWNL